MILYFYHIYIYILHIYHDLSVYNCILYIHTLYIIYYIHYLNTLFKYYIYIDTHNYAYVFSFTFGSSGWSSRSQGIPRSAGIWATFSESAAVNWVSRCTGAGRKSWGENGDIPWDNLRYNWTKWDIYILYYIYNIILYIYIYYIYI